MLVPFYFFLYTLHFLKIAWVWFSFRLHAQQRPRPSLLFLVRRDAQKKPVRSPFCVSAWSLALDLRDLSGKPTVGEGGGGGRSSSSSSFSCYRVKPSILTWLLLSSRSYKDCQSLDTERYVAETAQINLMFKHLQSRQGYIFPPPPSSSPHHTHTLDPSVQDFSHRSTVAWSEGSLLNLQSNMENITHSSSYLWSCRLLKEE